jgi:hypothetical protein
LHSCRYTFFWRDEVLLYFIVRVEVEIQIWFEFKLIYNL